MYTHKIRMCVYVCSCVSVCTVFPGCGCHVLFLSCTPLNFSMICQMNGWENGYSLHFHLWASAWGSIHFTLSQLFLRTAEMSETWRSWENLQMWNPQYFHISKQELSLKWDLHVHLGENTKISSRWGASIFLTLYRIEVTSYLNELVNPV